MIIKLDSDGDLAFESGSLVLLTGLDEIIQNLSQRLRFFYGEWFLDNREGVPYFEQILLKRPDPVIVDSVFKRAILMTPGVQELLSFGIDIDSSNRVMSLSFKARTKDGDLVFDDFEVP